jgi:hypothetical protein
MTNEIQRFDILGNPGSGKFTLWYKGEGTSDLPYHPAAGAVQTALEALTAIGAGNIVVTKDGNWGYVCSFTGNLANQQVPEIVADDSQLGGGGTIQVTTVTDGGPDTTGGGLTLQTPCTLTDLLVFAHSVVPATAGNQHNVPITTTATTITAAI